MWLWEHRTERKLRNVAIPSFCVQYYLLTYVLTYLITYLLTCLLAYLIIYLLTYLFTYLFTHLLTYLLTYVLTYVLTYLFTYLLNYLLTYLLTYSMEQRHSCEAYRLSASQEIPRISRNQPVCSLSHSQMPALFIIFNNLQKSCVYWSMQGESYCYKWRILRVLLLSDGSHILFITCTYFLSRYLTAVTIRTLLEVTAMIKSVSFIFK